MDSHRHLPSSPRQQSPRPTRHPRESGDSDLNPCQASPRMSSNVRHRPEKPKSCQHSARIPAAGNVHICPFLSGKLKFPASASVLFPSLSLSHPQVDLYPKLDRIGHFWTLFRGNTPRPSNPPTHRGLGQTSQIGQNWTLLDTFWTLFRGNPPRPSNPPTHRGPGQTSQIGHFRTLFRGNPPRSTNPSTCRGLGQTSQIGQNWTLFRGNPPRSTNPPTHRGPGQWSQVRRNGTVWDVLGGCPDTNVMCGSPAKGHSRLTEFVAKHKLVSIPPSRPA